MAYSRIPNKALGWMIISSLLIACLPAAAAPWNKKKKEKKQQELQASRVAYQPSGSWQPYFRDGNGEEYAFRTPAEKNHEIDWMFLRFTEWKGHRPILAVMAVENVVGHIQSNTVNVLGWGSFTSTSHIDMGPVEELVTTSLFATDRFDLVEREEIMNVLSEQDFGTTDRVTAQSAAQIGRLLGADYMLFTAINEWTEGRNRVAKIVKSSSTAEVAMSFKMIDTETAKIVFAGTYRAQTSDWAFAVPFFGKSETSPINYALSACINKAAYHLAVSLPNKPWRGRVAAVDGDFVTINGGENRGLQVGQVFSVMSVGDPVIDPTTGEVLGQESKVIGSVQVTSVEDRFSKAAVVEGCAGMNVTDFLEPQSSSEGRAGGASE